MMDSFCRRCRFQGSSFRLTANWFVRCFSVSVQAGSNPAAVAHVHATASTNSTMATSKAHVAAIMPMEWIRSIVGIFLTASMLNNLDSGTENFHVHAATAASTTGFNSLYALSPSPATFLTCHEMSADAAISASSAMADCAQVFATAYVCVHLFSGEVFVLGRNEDDDPDVELPRSKDKQSNEDHPSKYPKPGFIRFGNRNVNNLRTVPRATPMVAMDDDVLPGTGMDMTNRFRHFVPFLG